MNSPNYLPILVPALGLLVPFLIRWIENRSRLRQAQHLLDVIKTRDEISKLLLDAENEGLDLLENEEAQLRFYGKALEKEIKRNETLPFLEGIFSNSNIRISLLLFCLVASLYFTYSVQKRILLRNGFSKKTEIKIFGIFNLFFFSCILILGLVLFILDWVMPWF